MKKILTLSVLLLTSGAMAQTNPHLREIHRAYEDLSPAQRATLQTKKMVLALELDTSQQKQVESLLEGRFETRIKMHIDRREVTGDSSIRLTPEDRYTRMNAHLDQEIAFQNTMKQILTDSQFEQWKKRHSTKNRRHQKRQVAHRQGRTMHKPRQR